MNICVELISINGISYVNLLGKMLIHIAKLPSEKDFFSLQKSKRITCYSFLGGQSNIIAQNTKAVFFSWAAIKKMNKQTDKQKYRLDSL